MNTVKIRHDSCNHDVFYRLLISDAIIYARRAFNMFQTADSKQMLSTMVKNVWIKLLAVVDIRFTTLLPTKRGKYMEADMNVELQYVQSVQCNTAADAYQNHSDTSSWQVHNEGVWGYSIPNENGSTLGNVRAF